MILYNADPNNRKLNSMTAYYVMVLHHLEIRAMYVSYSSHCDENLIGKHQIRREKGNVSNLFTVQLECEIHIHPVQVPERTERDANVYRFL